MAKSRSKAKKSKSKSKPNAATSSAGVQPGLTRLPPELRLNIYELVFKNAEDPGMPCMLRGERSIRNMQTAISGPFNLMQTNQLIRKELTPLFAVYLRGLLVDLRKYILDVFEDFMSSPDHFRVVKRELAEKVMEKAEWCHAGIGKMQRVLQSMGESLGEPDRGPRAFLTTSYALEKMRNVLLSTHTGRRTLWY